MFFTRPLNHDYQSKLIYIYIKITYPYFICGVRLKIVNMIKLCQNIFKKILKLY
jgi:hypothetical protein